MRIRSRFVAVAAFGAIAIVTATTVPTAAQASDDTLVTAGSSPTPFAGNKQNEPAIAIDPTHPNIVAAGANDEIDNEACNAGADNTCPFTPGVGTSGISFSTTSGHTWTQPTYTGLSARGCTGAVGDSDADCTPSTGSIGTLPNYDTAGLVSDGDPALAFGPVRTNGAFSWTNGSRLYYANLASALPGVPAPFQGDEAIAVSHTDDIARAMAGHNDAWSAPVIASKQSGAKFSDKEQLWADNVSSSPFFGNVYVCYSGFRGSGNGYTNAPLNVIRSTDGGSSWTETQVTAAAANVASSQGFGRSGCSVRTDSHGVVYVFDFQPGTPGSSAAQGKIELLTSKDGGKSWSKPRTVFTAFDTCNNFEPTIARCVMDGVGGARDDLSPAPSIDIANGAPNGTDATDRIVMTWVDGVDGTNHEHVMFSSSTNGGQAWTSPVQIERTGDRGYYSAPAISPDGSDVYLVYNAFTTPFRESAEGVGNDRQLVGVVLHADVTGSGVGAFSEIHRGTSGDARGSSQNNLAAEFLGDYVYAAATRTYGTAVWNDVRNAADCPAIDAYRQALHDAATTTGAATAAAEEPRGESSRNKQPSGDTGPDAPNVQQVCPAAFGNSDIYGGSFTDPTP